MLDLAYINIQVLDLTELGLAQLQEAVDFVGRESGSGTVYIHCKAGYSRTAAVAGACLLASGEANSVDQAVTMLRKARPSIVIRPEARAALEEFGDACQNSKIKLTMNPQCNSSRATLFSGKT